jgi:hypothetical protein
LYWTTTAVRFQLLPDAVRPCKGQKSPTSASWLNLVEVWFSIIERQAIHRGTFCSVRDLTGRIRHFINGWNNRAQPFVWTKTADDILKKADRQQTSNTVH